VAKGFGYKGADHLAVLVFLDGNRIDGEVVLKESYTLKKKKHLV